MDKNIPDIVSQCLFTFGKVVIPGFGTFSISDSSSGFVLKDDVLKPPAQLVEFSEDTDGEEILINFLQTKHFYPQADAENAVNNYSKSLLNSLLNYGTVDISKIGRLTKLSNNEIVFDPNEDFINFDNYALPTLKLSPIDRGVTTKVEEAPSIVPAAATVAAFTPEVPKEDVKFTPAANEEVKKEVAPVVEAPKKEINEVVKEKTEVKKTVTEVIKEVPPPINYDDEPTFVRSFCLPITALFVVAALAFGFWKGCYQGKQATAVTEITDSNTVDSEGKVPETTNLEGWIKDNPKLEKYADALTEQNMKDGCIIIVGSFSKSRNAVKMKDRLIRGGYSPYSEVHNGFTRVGILFPCEEHDLAGYMDTIRRNYDRGAWYLSPELDVAR